MQSWFVIVSVYLESLWIVLVTVLEGRVASLIYFLHVVELLSLFIEVCMVNYDRIGIEL